MELTRITNVRFDELCHSYLCDDKVLIGITTLMKHQGISPNYEGIAPEVLADAAKRGTSVHTLLEKFDNKEVALPTDVLSDHFEGKVLQTAAEQSKILKSYASLGLQVECSEYLVTDGKVVASFIDKVFKDGSLADVKTTSTLHVESVSWQLSIYAYLFEKQNPTIKVPHLYAIHIRNGQAKLLEVPRVPDAEVIEVLRCEEVGELYQGKPKQDASVVLSDAEVVSLVDAETKIATYDLAVKEIKARSEAIKDRLYQYMLANNLDELQCAGGVFKLKRPYETSRVNSAKLKTKYPDIAAEVTTISEVKGSISFKPSEN
jgi:hypothetical protein